jgi:anaerobic magnesium-protoporphyrin IX monomethyl ester cyclase
MSLLLRLLRSSLRATSEIERNIEDFGCESICFVDETFMFDLKWCNELFEQMIRRRLNKKITWSCSTRVNNVSPKLFSLMKRAGCYYVFFGLESGDNTILKTIKKRITRDQITKAIRWAKEAGLICVGSFIIGLPGETRETVRTNIELAKELDLYSITFPIAVPFPGTELRKMAENNEYGMRILSDNWDDYGKQYPGVMESDALSIDERRELQKRGYEEHPKKELAKYMKRVSGNVQNAPALSAAEIDK